MEENEPKVLYIPVNPVNAVYNAQNIHIYQVPLDNRPQGGGHCQHNTNHSSGQEKPVPIQFMEKTFGVSNAVLEGEGAKNPKVLVESASLSLERLKHMLDTDTALSNVENETVKLAAFAYLIYGAMQ